MKCGVSSVQCSRVGRKGCLVCQVGEKEGGAVWVGEVWGSAECSVAGWETRVYLGWEWRHSLCLTTPFTVWNQKDTALPSYIQGKAVPKSERKGRGGKRRQRKGKEGKARVGALKGRSVQGGARTCKGEKRMKTVHVKLKAKRKNYQTKLEGDVAERR